MFTTIPYKYRDAANFKAYADILLEGELSAEDIALIRSKLSDGANFIPADLSGIDIEEIQSQLTSFPSEDDHVWHELSLDERFVMATAPEGATVIPVAAFVEAFRKIDGPAGWDIEAAVIRLDI